MSEPDWHCPSGMSANRHNARAHSARPLLNAAIPIECPEMRLSELRDRGSIGGYGRRETGWIICHVQGVQAGWGFVNIIRCSYLGLPYDPVAIALLLFREREQRVADLTSTANGAEDLPQDIQVTNIDVDRVAKTAAQASPYNRIGKRVGGSRGPIPWPGSPPSPVLLHTRPRNNARVSILEEQHRWQ
ncbi:hypothetical protein [Microvirga calopogonii]|uniref:hypothetical protein n=1 Tax=Microvirga calopogonii TaxID=2078013 RepID=UPI0013B42373|nr:hypothetical protein [Microvirga calopogonii]